MNTNIVYPEVTEEEKIAWCLEQVKKDNWHDVIGSYAYLLRDVLVEGFFMEKAEGDGYDRYEIKDGVYTHISLTTPDKEWETILILNIPNIAQVAHYIPHMDLRIIYRHRGGKE